MRTSQGNRPNRGSREVEDLVVKDDAQFSDDVRIRGDLDVDGKLEHR